MFRIQHDLPRASFFRASPVWLVPALATTTLVGACSSNSSSNRDGGVCATGGTAGPADNHCVGPDGGTMVTAVDPAACQQTASAADDAGAGDQACPYGATMFGQEGDDDDCKYHVSWSSTPICQGTVTFTVVATNLGAGTPVTGAQMSAEVFTSTPGDRDSAAYCDSNSSHGTPTDHGSLIPFSENPKGTYTGSFVVDEAGLWTVRFHFFESCFDAPTSAHGHAAFHITVP